MKNTKILLTFIVSMILSWLFFTIFWALFAQMSYYQTLINPGQFAGFVMLYWWCPGVFIIADIFDE